MSKGISGQQIAKQNIKLVQAWINERNALRDWIKYGHNGKINRRVLSDELGFAKSVCTQNKAVRVLIEEADSAWFKKIAEHTQSQQAVKERMKQQSNLASANTIELTQRIAELEIENKDLQRELTKFKKQQLLVQSGAAGFRV